MFDVLPLSAFPTFPLLFPSATTQISSFTYNQNPKHSKESTQDFLTKYRRGITPNGYRWAVNLSLGGIAIGWHALQSGSSTSMFQSTRRYFELFRRCFVRRNCPQYDHRGSTSTSARVGGVLWSPCVF